MEHAEAVEAVGFPAAGVAQLAAGVVQHAVALKFII